MQTFEAFYKILKKSLGILVYLGIFILMAIGITISFGESSTNTFSSSNVSFTIIDQDNSSLSHALISYLSKDNKFKEIEDNMDDIRNALYYRDIYYALVIPQGFEEDFINDKMPETESIKLQDSSFGYLLDQEIDGYFATLHTYLASGDDLASAIWKTENIFDDTIEVSLLEELQSGEVSDDYEIIPYFYNFLAYIFAGILTSAICPILIIFHKKIVRNRIAVSSQTFWSHNAQLAMGILLFAIIVVGILNLIGLLLFHERLTITDFLLYIINTMCFAIVSVGLAFMGGNLFRKDTSVLGFTVVLPMVIAFLGGIFVPLSVLGDTMQSIAKLMPSYWYIQANDAISTGTGNLTGKLSSMSEGLLIQLLFAIALFCIGLVAAKKQRES